MKKCIYKNIIVIGCGTIAATVVEYVIKLRELYNYHCEFIKYEMRMPSPIKNMCEDANVIYLEISDNDKLEQHLVSINQKTLVLSAGNYYLFPETVIKNESLTILNFHNALLPKYPGINAPSWCIFNGETETGITWHYVTFDIDAGDIVYQKKILIENEVKAYELVAKLMELAQKGLEDIFDSLMNGSIACRKQEGVRGPVCYSKILPGGCAFNLDDEPDYIYKLLRALDLGRPRVFPTVKFRLDNQECEVLKYKKTLFVDFASQSNWLCIKMDSNYCLQIKYKKVEA